MKKGETNFQEEKYEDILVDDMINIIIQKLISQLKLLNDKKINELNLKTLSQNNFLFHGENEGFKNQIIDEFIKKKNFKL